MGNGCLFGTHIHKGGFSVGILGIVLSVAIIGWCLFFHSFVMAGVGSASFLCYVALTIGNYMEIGVWYWIPILLLPLVILAELAFALLTLVVHGAAMLLTPKELETDKDAQVMMQAYPQYFMPISQPALAFGGVIALLAFLQIYFFVVIVRSYRYLLKVRKYPPPLTVGWSHRV